MTRRGYATWRVDKEPGGHVTATRPKRPQRKCIVDINDCSRTYRTVQILLMSYRGGYMPGSRWRPRLRVWSNLVSPTTLM